MSIKGARTIAEYAIRKWLIEQNFDMECFSLSMEGNEGVLKDKNNDSMKLVYDAQTKSVYVNEE